MSLRIEWTPEKEEQVTKLLQDLYKKSEIDSIDLCLDDFVDSLIDILDPIVGGKKSEFLGEEIAKLIQFYDNETKKHSLQNSADA